MYSNAEDAEIYVFGYFKAKWPLHLLFKIHLIFDQPMV